MVAGWSDPTLADCGSEAAAADAAAADAAAADANGDAALVWLIQEILGRFAEPNSFVASW